MRIGQRLALHERSDATIADNAQSFGRYANTIADNVESSWE